MLRIKRKIIVVVLALSWLPMIALGQTVESPLFRGTTADVWLVDPETGQVTGYNTGFWSAIDVAATSSTLGLDGDEALLINLLPSSSVPMTPGQPQISLIGIGEAALNLGDGGEDGHRDLIISPDRGEFTETTAVDLGVSRALLAQGTHELSWNLVDSDTLATIRTGSRTLGANADGEGQSGFVSETVFLIESGALTLNAELRRGGTLVASKQASFTMNVDPSQRRRDSDGDGIPDLVELDMGLDPLEDDWTLDADGDGWSEFDEWLRRFCLDPATGQPIAGDTSCLDADGLPLDSDADNWSDFDEILRGTNHLDPEPVLDSGGTPPLDTGGGSGGSAEILPPSIKSANFCTAGDTFYFDLQFYGAADDSVLADINISIAADGSPYQFGNESIGMNFGENGQITRQTPTVFSSLSRPDGVAPIDRWLDGEIADYSIDKISGFDWHVTGSFPVGTEPFVPGDEVSSFGLRTFLTDPQIQAFGGPYVISGDPADCQTNPLPPPPDTSGDLTASDKRLRLRFKDFPAAQRLYEVERVIASSAGQLTAPPPATLAISQESAGGLADTYSSSAIQTFTAARDNLAGIDVLLATDSTEEIFDDVTVNVWQESRRNGEILVSRTLRNVRVPSAGTTPVSFRFEPAALSVGQPVFVEFRMSAADIVSTGADTLPGGSVIDVGGASTAGDTDLVFTAYYDSAFAAGVGGTRSGMQWWNIGAADLNGQLAYDGATLLRDSEILAAGLTVADVAPRRRMDTLEAALLAGEMPLMRLPAGESLVLAAVHRHRSAPVSDWQRPADYSRIYKAWLTRFSDVTPVDMLSNEGEGTWVTPEEWRAAFIAYLETNLTVDASPVLNADSTLAVAVMESALSEEASLGGDETLELLTPVFQPGQPVYLWQPADALLTNPAADPSPYVEDWEQNLGRLTDTEFTLDQSFAEVVSALAPGNPLAGLGDWLRARLYQGVPGTASDRWMASQVRRSFDGTCFVRSDLVAFLQADVDDWNAFLDRCPVWYDETGIDQRLDADRERRYQVRVNLLPNAFAEIANDTTLLTRDADSDADGLVNVAEIGVPVDEVTLPWLGDSDGDLVADGNDLCPNDPFDNCSANPIRPTVTVEADFTFFEPSTTTGSALIAVQIDRLYDVPVTVCYEAFVDVTDTATAGDDFESIAGCVTIEPGQLSALIEVPVYVDGIAEGAESFSVSIISVENGVVADDGIVVVTLNDTVPSSLPPEVLLAQTSIVSDERDSVALDASASTDPNGETLSFTWTQVPNAAPVVSLQGGNSSQASFVAPVTLDPLTLEFEVQVTNESSLSAVDRVTVTVNPVNDSPFVAAEVSDQVVAGGTLEFTDATLLGFVDDPDNDLLTTGAILSQPSIGRVEDIGDSFLYTSSVEPTLETDQVNDIGPSGGIGTPVVQTFIPQQTNLAGVDAYLNGTSALTADVSVNVWPAGAVGVGEPLASTTILDHPRLSEIPFRFDPIQVTPGQSYALEFIFSRLGIGVISDTYPDGEVIGRPGTDVYFRTYYDPTFPLQVPLPDQVSPGGVSGGYGDPVVQTFVPQQSSLTGIDASLIGTGALSSDVTVRVWRTAALRVGEPLLVSTLADVPRSTTMNFRFPAVPVTPGESYAMEFIISDALIMGAVIPGQYPDGAVIEGGGNLFNGGADLQFTTYYDAAFTPSELLATRVSEPQIVTWELLGNDQQLLMHESGSASDFPGNDRVIAVDLESRARTLLLEGAPTEFHTGNGASASWFTFAGELHRFDAEAGESFATSPIPASLPGTFSATAVDPRNGDLLYCGGADPVLGLPGWIRIDSGTLEPSGPVGNCPGSADVIGAPVGERFCLVFDQSNLICTSAGGNDFAAEFPATAFGGEDYRMIGLVPTGSSTLLFVVRESAGVAQAMSIYLIDESGFDPAAANPLVALEPLLLLERIFPIGVMPEVEVMPDGRAVVILAPSQSAGENGQPLEMWTWSGDPTDLTMSQIEIGNFPVFNNHMGDLATVNGLLYWQVQNHESNTEREVYVVDPVPGAIDPIGLFATVPGSFDGEPPETSSSAPYEFLIAGPETFGVFVDAGVAGICDILQLPALDPVQDNVNCRRFDSVPGTGALYEADDPGDGDVQPDDLILLGTGRATTGPTSFSIEVTDGEFTIGLPINLEVIEP